MRLKKIDLSKLSLESDNHNHPDIKVEGPHYLVRFGSDYYTGIFSKQWYGIVFEGKYPAGCQMNYSEWDDAELWEIQHNVNEKRKYNWSNGPQIRVLLQKALKRMRSRTHSFRDHDAEECLKQAISLLSYRTCEGAISGRISREKG